MLKFKNFIVFLLLLTTAYSYGQNRAKQGYIITSQNDTLRGELRFKSDSLLLFKAVGAAAIEEYQPDNVKAAYKDGKTYTTENVLGKNKFLQEVITGHLNLYMFKEGEVAERFFLKRNDTVVVVTQMNSAGVLAYYLRQCEDEKDLVSHKNQKRFKYNLNGLTELVTYYNSCQGYEKEQVIKYMPEKFQFKPVLYAGLDMHELKFGENDKHNPGASFGNKQGFVVGATSRVLGKDTGLSLWPAIQFSHKEGFAKLTGVGPNSFTSVDMDISANFIEAPILLRYTFGGNNIRPFVTVGPHVGMAFFSTIEREPYGFVYKNEYEKRASNMGVKYGASAGAGIYFPNILKGMELEFRAEKSYYEGEFDTPYLESTAMQAKLGFYLK